MWFWALCFIYMNVSYKYLNESPKRKVVKTREEGLCNLSKIAQQAVADWDLNLEPRHTIMTLYGLSRV